MLPPVPYFSRPRLHSTRTQPVVIGFKLVEGWQDLSAVHRYIQVIHLYSEEQGCAEP
jgi:hypothetical protein